MTGPMLVAPMRQDEGMSVLRALGRTVGTTARVARGVTVGGVRAGRLVSRNVGTARRRGAAGEAGMLRLLDLHAASCAGDALVTIALAGTIFFSVPLGEARGRVALYLLITMLPFVVLAPVIGPALDRFRHGRRYALATTFLGRAFLAYLMFEHLDGFALYPAAFGMLVLSRAYGVARSAAVPRLLPPGLGLSEAGARASLFGTIAGAIVLPLGVIAGLLVAGGPLLLAMVAFFFGMVTALRLPPRADSEPPEAMPRMFQRGGRKGAKVLSGRLVVATLTGGATLRALYGFLTLYLAFAIKAGAMPDVVAGFAVTETAAIAAMAVALGVGSFLATAIGTRLRIQRPALLQGIGIVGVAAVGAVAAIEFTLPFVALLCLVTAATSGLAKLAVDAVIQERIDERVRASAFAHSETLLMVAWVIGGAIGLIPFTGRWGLAVAAVFLALGAARAVYSAAALRRDRLHGEPMPEAAADPEATRAVPDQPARPGDHRTAENRPGDDRTAEYPPGHRTAEYRPGDDRTTQPRPAHGRDPVTAPTGRPPRAAGAGDATTRKMPVPPPQRDAPRRPVDRPAEQLTEQPAGPKRFGWRRRRSARPAPDPQPMLTPREPVKTRRLPAEAPISPAPDAEPPGYTLYRPSGIDPTARLDADGDGPR